MTHVAGLTETAAVRPRRDQHQGDAVWARGPRALGKAAGLVSAKPNIPGVKNQKCGNIRKQENTVMDTSP